MTSLVSDLSSISPFEFPLDYYAYLFESLAIELGSEGYSSLLDWLKTRYNLERKLISLKKAVDLFARTCLADDTSIVVLADGGKGGFACCSLLLGSGSSRRWLGWRRRGMGVPFVPCPHVYNIIVNRWSGHH